MKVVEENILRYAAGFVPFSLKKKCAKRKTRTDYMKQTIKCLNALGVDDELTGNDVYEQAGEAHEDESHEKITCFVQ